jgi:hypothetical protein
MKQNSLKKKLFKKVIIFLKILLGIESKLYFSKTDVFSALFQKSFELRAKQYSFLNFDLILSEN